MSYFKSKAVIVFYSVKESGFEEDEFYPLKNYAYLLTSITHDN
jgi:hypothetical protein